MIGSKTQCVLMTNTPIKITGNRRYSFKEKGGEEFAIDKEIAFDRVRLRLEFNRLRQIPKCTFVNCPYETIEKERILGRLPKHREIQKTKGHLCPYCHPSFAKLYTLTRHLYETSCPKLKERIQNNEIIDWKHVWKDTVQINNTNN